MARQPQKRMYRTMQGRLVDIEKLRMSNESVQAVGNMNVNARGDVLGAGGKVITTKEQIMKQYYETPKGRASEAIINSAQTEPAVQQETKQSPVALKKIQPQDTVVETSKPSTKTVSTFKPKVKDEVKKTEASSEQKTGIDAALDGIE